MTHKSFILTILVCAALLAACNLSAVPGATLPAPTQPVQTQVLTPISTDTLPPVVTATSAPTAVPTAGTTAVPTATLTAAPTSVPTKAPTAVPTKAPTVAPTAAPTTIPGTISRFASGSDVTLTQVRMFSMTEGWGVGRNTALDPADEHVLRTTDGGATWRDVTPPQARGAGSTADGPSLQAEPFFLDAARAWVGFWPQPGSGVNANKIWYTVDGGQTWATLTTVTWVGAQPEFVSASAGWAVAFSGQAPNVKYALVSSANGGVSWALIKTKIK